MILAGISFTLLDCTWERIVLCLVCATNNSTNNNYYTEYNLPYGNHIDSRRNQRTETRKTKWGGRRGKVEKGEYTVCKERNVAVRSIPGMAREEGKQIFQSYFFG